MPAEPGRLAGELRELRRVGVAAWRVIEAGRHPPGTLLHGGPQQRLLVRHLVSRGGPVAPADGADAQRRVADDVGDVHRHAPREHVEVLLDGGPPAGEPRVTVEPGVDLHELQEVIVGVERGVGVAVDADQLRSDALTDLRLVLRLGEDHQPGVRVHVDEPGADHAAGGVDDAPGLDAGRVAAQDADALVLDGDGAVEARVARAVDDEPSADEQVEHGGSPRRRRFDQCPTNR
jgi:hypothetical protein